MRRHPAPQEFIGYKKHILLFMDLLSALWYNKRSLCSLPERLSKGARQTDLFLWEIVTVNRDGTTDR